MADIKTLQGLLKEGYGKPGVTKQLPYHPPRKVKKIKRADWLKGVPYGNGR